MNLRFRKATERDLTALVEIEKACFPTPHWTRKDFLAYDCTVAELEGEIAGLLVVRQTYGGDAGEPAEREVLNLAVAPPFRRLGIAAALLKREMQPGVVYYLEVRESNVAAQTLYRKLGFEEIGRRADYYRNPAEAAIVMQMKWC